MIGIELLSFPFHAGNIEWDVEWDEKWDEERTTRRVLHWTLYHEQRNDPLLSEALTI